MLSRRRKRALIVLLILGLPALAYWVAVTPGNPLFRLLRHDISDPDAHVIFGPYPEEEDLRLLKNYGVTTVISLLDPRLPYENALLDKERERVTRHGLKLLSFPMISLWGRPVGDDYDAHAVKAAEAAAGDPGKVYIHCYLALHRAKSVQDLLKARNATMSTYLGRKGERSEDDLLMDAASTDRREGRYEEAIRKLRQVKARNTRRVLLEAWCLYRTQDIAGARALFTEAAGLEPDNPDAQNGLGFCALREGELEAAAGKFSSVLEKHPEDSSAGLGMGMVRYRQDRQEEAAAVLEGVLKSNPDNREARDLLDKINASR